MGLKNGMCRSRNRTQVLWDAIYVKFWYRKQAAARGTQQPPGPGRWGRPSWPEGSWPAWRGGDVGSPPLGWAGNSVSLWLWPLVGEVGVITPISQGCSSVWKAADRRKDAGVPETEPSLRVGRFAANKGHSSVCGDACHKAVRKRTPGSRGTSRPR